MHSSTCKRCELQIVRVSQEEEERANECEGVRGRKGERGGRNLLKKTVYMQNIIEIVNGVFGGNIDVERGNLKQIHV